MAELQTTYATTLAKGYSGMVIDGETSNRITRSVEDSAGIAFGRPVYRGSGDRGCTGTVGTLATFLGWTIATTALGKLPGNDDDEYQQYDSAAVLTGGAMIVTCTGNVTDGAAVTIGTGAGVADGIGATAADATHIATGWVFDETVTGGGLVRIVKR
ncbi:MAG: hypothetical protein RLZZ475_2542 [Pseudomonadota bacterium]|jgi:hypothetical protein